MSKYKVGDEVLVRCSVLDIDCDGDVELSFDYKIGGTYYSNGLCEDERIVCLASEFERNGWVDVKDGSPVFDGFFLATVAYDEGPEVNVLYYGIKEDDWYVDKEKCTRVLCEITAWMPIAGLQPYTPPAPKLDCNSCMCKDVCRFKTTEQYIDSNVDCGGKHYHEQP